MQRAQGTSEGASGQGGRTSRRLVLIGTAYPYRGGIAQFLETMYRGLGARGHRVWIVTFTRQYPGLFFPGKTEYVTTPVPNPPPTTRLIDSVNPASWFRAGEYVRSLHPDALVFKYWMPFFAPAYGTIARIAKRGGAKILAVVDNAIPHERHPGDAALSRYFLTVCDGLIVMSDAVERDLDELGVRARRRKVGHPVYDIFGRPLPREEARRQLGLPADVPLLLFFGFVRRYKGLKVLLEAMRHVVPRLPEVRLLVAGEFYEDGDFYRDYIGAHGLEKHVILHDRYIPETEVAAYFCAADVVVQPYVSATQSGVAQIAYHFERPLIVTDVGGLAEMVPHEKAGLVVPPEDPEKLAEAIVRFFREGLGDRLVQGVREEKGKYTWERLYEAIESLIEPE